MQKIINFDDVTKENKKKTKNLNWRQISDYPYRIFIIGGSGSRKTNSLFNLIIHQPDIYSYAKDPYEVKYQWIINKKESKGFKSFQSF